MAAWTSIPATLTLQPEVEMPWPTWVPTSTGEAAAPAAQTITMQVPTTIEGPTATFTSMATETMVTTEINNLPFTETVSFPDSAATDTPAFPIPLPGGSNTIYVALICIAFVAAIMLLILLFMCGHKRGKRKQKKRQQEEGQQAGPEYAQHTAGDPPSTDVERQDPPIAPVPAPGPVPARGSGGSLSSNSSSDISDAERHDTERLDNERRDSVTEPEDGVVRRDHAGTGLVPGIVADNLAHPHSPMIPSHHAHWSRNLTQGQPAASSA